MRALVFLGPGRLELMEVPTPEPGPGEVLVRVRAAGICATDKKIFLRGHPRVVPPRVLGHEIVGEVVALGSGVEGVEPGYRVSVAPNFGCGHCEYCSQGWTNLCPERRALGIDVDGGFAEYLLIPAKAVAQGNLLLLPQEIPDEVGVLAEPLATALSAQEALGVSPGDTVLIIGGGPMGILNALAAKLRGAALVVLVERRFWRRSLAERLGVDLALPPEEVAPRVKELTHGRGVAAVTVTVADTQAVDTALSLLAPLGRLNLFAGFPQGEEKVTLNANTLHYGNRAILGTFAANLKQHRAAVALLSRVDFSPLISRQVALEQAEAAFPLLVSSKEEMRVVIKI